MSSFPVITVTLAGHEPFVARAVLADMTAFERLSVREGLPAVTEAPMLWTGNIAFLAAKRSGLLPEGVSTYEAFEALVEDMEVVTDTEADPTPARSRTRKGVTAA